MKHIFESVSSALPQLCEYVLENGHEIGRGDNLTKELLMQQVELTQPWQREVLTPGRKASLPAQIAETMWVLAGRNDVDWLSHYLPRAPLFSDDGETWRGAYGSRLRGDGGDGGFDQLRYVVDLLRSDRGTRRAVMAIYDPQRDSLPGKDVPCNDMIQLISRLGRLHMHVFVRSNDVMWGWSGINTFEWSALQEIVAHMVGVEVGSLVFSTTSLHLYSRHWKRAEGIVSRSDHPAWMTQSVKDSPRFRAVLSQEDPVGDLDQLLGKWFVIEATLREQGGSLTLRDSVNRFPEPMLRSWLRVIGYYWSRDPAWLEELHDTRLAQAAYASPERAGKIPPHVAQDGPVNGLNAIGFMEEAARMHREKGAAYRGSWARRGETLGILANIARKVDRLGGAETRDETSADTATDLMVYLAKYVAWLQDPNRAIDGEEHTAAVEAELARLPRTISSNITLEEDEADLRSMFDRLELQVEQKDSAEDKLYTVKLMLLKAHRLAARRRVLENKATWKAGNATRTWKGYDA